MKLEQLYSIIPDSAVIRVLSNGKEIARYDGRNSIPANLNNKTVLLIEAGYGIAVTVWIDWQEENMDTLHRILCGME